MKNQSNDERIWLDPVLAEVLVDGVLKTIDVKIYREPGEMGIYFETSIKHESGSYTDCIAGGGIDMNSMLADIERKVKKYFEYDCPSFRIMHHAKTKAD
jgi:hypothetical protein